MFTETQDTKLACVFIDSPELSRAYDRLVSVCADIVFVDKDGRFVLAYRKIHSAHGWWWKGGSVRRGETNDQSLARLMKREIGFIPEGIEFLNGFDHLWDLRQEAPQENGKHDRIYLHYVQADEKMISKMRLDPAEYDVTRGLMRYDGTQKVRPAVQAAYRRYKALQVPEVREAIRAAEAAIARHL